MCEGGDIGRAAIWGSNEPMRIQNHIHRLRAYVPVCTRFFYYLFYLYKGAGWIGGKGIAIQGLSSNDTQYCETLYHYLTCCRSLKKTCDALFTHRNTVLYRIHRMQDDFLIPLDDSAVHADLLLGVSLLLFEEKGPDFFLHTMNKAESEE